jgi:hypothetical protein
VKTKHEIFVKKGDNGAEWDYYIDTHWSFFNLINTGQVFPALVFCGYWWETYPVDEHGKRLVWPDGEPMYSALYIKDPRTAKT